MRCALPTRTTLPCSTTSRSCSTRLRVRAAAAPWGRGTGEGIGLSGHKNEFRAGVRISNWVEEKFGQEAVGNGQTLKVGCMAPALPPHVHALSHVALLRVLPGRTS